MRFPNPVGPAAGFDENGRATESDANRGAISVKFFLRRPLVRPREENRAAMVVHLNLGSNVGPRLEALRRAVAMLGALRGVEVLRVSRVFETPPFGLSVPSGPFLNVCAEIETDLALGRLLELTQGIEIALGRGADAKGKNLPRPIDIDIVVAEDRVRRQGPPILPHPGLKERVFFLRPLLELAPDIRDPETGRPLRDWLARVEDQPVIGTRAWPGTPPRLPRIANRIMPRSTPSRRPRSP